MNIKGIDISKHNGTVDFNKIKNDGVKFVIIRGGYGSLEKQKDVKFEEYYKKAKEVGLPLGVYWYSYAVNTYEAKAEAEMCLQVIRGKQFEYPIYFDLEERSAFDTGKTNCSEMVKIFCNTLEKSGYFAGLYMSRSYLQNYITDEVRRRYALWIAEYNSSCNYDGNYGMWQYSSTGQVSGVKGNCDMDRCYIDYPSIIVNGGYNGYRGVNSVSKPIYKVGDSVVFSSCYKKSTDGENNAIRLHSKEFGDKYKTATIVKVLTDGCRNPYLLSDGYYVNNGDIRACKSTSFYPKYSGKSVSIVDALESLGIDSSYEYREKIAKANGIKDYLGLPWQNLKMLELLKSGQLIRV